MKVLIGVDPHKASVAPGEVAGKLSADRVARILRGMRFQGCASDRRLGRRLASEMLRLESGRWTERSWT